MMNVTSLNASLVEQSQESAFDLFLSKHYIYFDMSLYILYSLIFLFGVIGNSIVIYVLVSSLCINRNMQIFNEQTIIGRNNKAGHFALQPLASSSTHAHALQAFNNSFKNLLKKRPSTPNAEVSNNQNRGEKTNNKHSKRSHMNIISKKSG